MNSLKGSRLVAGDMEYSLLSELTFGALLTYTAHGSYELAQQSLKLRDSIKHCTPYATKRFSELLCEHLQRRGILTCLFQSSELVLVPVPKRAPLPPKDRTTGVLWPSFQYCIAIQQAGIKCKIKPCLERAQTIRKSAFAGPGQRPDPDEHMASLLFSGPPCQMDKNILLVDDFITRGSTMIGAASILHAALPTATIQGFAVVRTVYPGELKALVDPCVGQVIFKDGVLRREP